jgi:hypothetical protein
MATWYVNSAAAGTGAGTSWANACTTLAAAIALSSAGDDFDVASTHAETTASALTLTFKGTAAAPNRVFSCDTTNSPAQASDLLAGASVTTTGTSALSVSGFVYIYGVTFNCATSTGVTNLTIASAAGNVILDTCALKVLATSSTSALICGNSVAGVDGSTTWINTTVQLSNAGQSIQVMGGRFRWLNTPSAIVSGTPPNTLFVNSSTARGVTVLCDGIDLSALSGKALVAALPEAGYVQFVNCRLPASVTIASAPSAWGQSIDLVNTDSGATGCRQERYQYPGTQTTETTNTLSGGASDGVQPISWKVAANANASRVNPFECFQIAQWFGTGLGSSHTMTFQVLAPAGLTNADIWVDVEYLGNASYPLSSKATSAPATPLTAGSALSTSGAGSWGGSTGDTAYTIPVTFTPQLAGYVRATVRIAKASATLYVDPSPVIV